MKFDTKKNSKILVIVLMVAFIRMHAQSGSGTIEVTIENIESNKGSIVVGLYKNPENFLKKPFEHKKLTAQNGKLTTTFEGIESGIYAISLYHDEDDNGKINTNMLGIPTEDYGISNNAKNMFGPPKWEDAKFSIKSGEIVKQHIQL